MGRKKSPNLEVKCWWGKSQTWWCNYHSPHVPTVLGATLTWHGTYLLWLNWHFWDQLRYWNRIYLLFIFHTTCLYGFLILARFRCSYGHTLGALVSATFASRRGRVVEGGGGTRRISKLCAVELSEKKLVDSSRWVLAIGSVFILGRYLTQLWEVERQTFTKSGIFSLAGP